MGFHQILLFWHKHHQKSLKQTIPRDILYEASQMVFDLIINLIKIFQPKLMKLFLQPLLFYLSLQLSQACGLLLRQNNECHFFHKLLLYNLLHWQCMHNCLQRELLMHMNQNVQYLVTSLLLRKIFVQRLWSHILMLLLVLKGKKNCQE